MKRFVMLLTAGLLAVGSTLSQAHTDRTNERLRADVEQWNRIALEAVARAKPSQHAALRLMTHLSLAQHAAVELAGGRSQDAVAGASMLVIAALLPGQAGYVEERLRAMDKTVSQGARRVAGAVLAEARQDGFNQAGTTDAVPPPQGWRSLVNPPAPPALPRLGRVRTQFLDRGDVLRPAPPPALGSERFERDLAEVRSLTQAPTEASQRLARFYDMTTGTLVAGFWNDRAMARVASRTVTASQATRVLVTLNAAMFDAVIACHDAKYHWWVPRPSQVDAGVRPLIGVPNHPSYPSNHSCISTAAALVLADFFPRDAEQLLAMAAEAGESRIQAGLHYRFDVEAGESIGRQVAVAARERKAELLARWSGTTLGAGAVTRAAIAASVTSGANWTARVCGRVCTGAVP